MAGHGPVDFFGAQERAKRYTGRLILLMVLALVSLIAMASLAVALVVVLTEGSAAGQQGPQTINAETFTSALDPQLIGTTALAVLALVVLGSLFKHMQLRSGGRAVAEAMGGRLLNVQTRDANERQILNIVEEMALASGMPVPAVYLLEDPAINAFAAGNSPRDAVIGITRGAIDLLDRDELQGVVAHEFSHILNGDMRLNLRLVALLHGLLLLGLVGHMVLRGSAVRGMAGGGRRDNSHAVMLALGAALMVIGYVGTLCGSLIKAAVSRQREFLADASAVQFTRQPEGIGGALKKIAAYQRGSRLQASNAAEYSHFYFSRGVAASGPLSTHPPLETRIRRVLPGWDGELPSLDKTSSESRRRAEREEATLGPERRGSHGQVDMPMNSRALIASALATIGTLDQPHLDQARQTLAALDKRLLQAAHDPFAARALAYGIMMSLEPDSRDRQYALLDQYADPAVVSELDDLFGPFEKLEPQYRLALLELAMPVLKQLSTSQYAVFKTCLGKLVDAERSPGAMQWALYRVLVHGIEGSSERRREVRLTDLEEPVALLLATMARAGKVDEEEARRAFNAAQAVLPELSLTYRDAPASFAELDMAMDRLLGTRHPDRSRLLESLAVCIEHDEQVSVTEAELFRALADTLECPMPPLLTSRDNRPEGAHEIR